METKRIDELSKSLTSKSHAVTLELAKAWIERNRSGVVSAETMKRIQVTLQSLRAHLDTIEKEFGIEKGKERKNKHERS